jgi:hypothetical protein
MMHIHVLPCTHLEQKKRLLECKWWGGEKLAFSSCEDDDRHFQHGRRGTEIVQGRGDLE